MSTTKDHKAKIVLAKHLNTTIKKLFSIHYIDYDKNNLNINNLLHVSYQEKTFLEREKRLISRSLIDEKNRVLYKRLWHSFEKIVWFSHFPALESLKSNDVPCAKKEKISISYGTDP